MWAHPTLCILVIDPKLYKSRETLSGPEFQILFRNAAMAAKRERWLPFGPQVTRITRWGLSYTKKSPKHSDTARCILVAFRQSAVHAQGFTPEARGAQLEAVTTIRQKIILSKNSVISGISTGSDQSRNRIRCPHFCGLFERPLHFGTFFAAVVPFSRQDASFIVIVSIG